MTDEAAGGQTAAAPPTSGINVEGFPILKQAHLDSELKPLIGKPLTLGELNGITKRVVGIYRQAGHPLVNAFVPEQDVDSGVVRIVVMEYKVGEVRVVGNKWFSAHDVARPIRFGHGDAVNSRSLLNQLDMINANPFRRVNLMYEPSATPGYTDLVLQEHDRFPLRVFSSFDNSGTPVTGRERWNLGVTWGNALWHASQVSYQLSTSSDFWTGGHGSTGQPNGASFAAHSLTWTTPISSTDSVSVFGVYARSIPNLGSDLGLQGVSGQASIRYNRLLPRTDHFTQSVSAGYDFKTTNNNLAFGGTEVSRNTTEIDQLPVEYTASLMDQWGLTTSSSTFVWSPGNITPENNAGAFRPAAGHSGRPEASARYVYLRSELSRVTRLPAGLSWSSRITAQVSSTALLDTEELAAGGSEVLRGYNPFAFLGDNGVVLSNELRSAAFKAPGRSEGGRLGLGYVQVLGFWDYASVHNNHSGSGVLANADGSSVGAGLRYNLRSYAAVRFDYGWQLQRAPGATGLGSLANISLTLGK